MPRPQIMRLDVGDPLSEEALKRIPPALVGSLVETVGPVEYPRPLTPVSVGLSIDDCLDFPCKCPVGECSCP